MQFSLIQIEHIKNHEFLIFSMNDGQVENDTLNLMMKTKMMRMNHPLQQIDRAETKASLKRVPVTKGDLPVMILMKQRRNDPNENISQEIYSQMLYSKLVPSRQKILH